MECVQGWQTLSSTYYGFVTKKWINIVTLHRKWTLMNAKLPPNVYATACNSDFHIQRVFHD